MPDPPQAPSTSAAQTSDMKGAPAPGPTKMLRMVCALLFVSGGLAIFWLHDDFGVTWDEGVQATYGELVRSYFTSGGADTRHAHFGNLRYYGPAFELLAATLTGSDGAAGFSQRHAIIAFTALLCILGVIVIGTRLARLSAGLLAGLALLMMPRFLGHAFTNSKDIPFAAAVVACVLFFLPLTRARPSWRAATSAGLALGLALGVRPAGIPILLGLLLLSHLVGVLMEREKAQVHWRVRLLGLIATLTLGWTLMVVVWPWAHSAPLAHPLDAMRFAFSFPTTYPVLFDGVVYPSNDLPGNYLPMLLLITTPMATLGLAAVGLLVSVRMGARVLPLLAWLAGPLLYVVVLRPNIYDGIRHFLFLLPAIAVLAGLGADALIQRVTHLGLATVLRASLLLALAAPLLPIVWLHPYEATFFNAMTGGVSGAAGRYETDYWLWSYRECVAWINAQPHAPDQPLRVIVAGNELSRTSATPFAAPGVKMAFFLRDPPPGPVPPGFDFALLTTRYGLDQSFAESPVVHRVGRGRAVFCVVRQRVP